MVRSRAAASSVTVDLTAVVVSVQDGQPQVLVVAPGADGLDGLPSGPLRAEHGTLQAGLRSWVEQQTQHRLGYVEQLYTFGDRPTALPHDAAGKNGRTLSIAYLALASVPARQSDSQALRHSWYSYFPWEDWRGGEPAVRKALLKELRRWSNAVSGKNKQARRERVGLAFGLSAAAWDDERVLERYELLYEARLVPEAWRDRGRKPPASLTGISGRPMTSDCRRILATAISRLRGKIKYRPVLFELLPQRFTLFQLQRTAEALSGIRLHKQNFRRLVAQQGLVEETGEVEFETGGRPAKLMRFRREVTLERPAPGVRVTATGRPASA